MWTKRATCQHVPGGRQRAGGPVQRLPNGLAYKHFIGYRKSGVGEHDVIEYCEAHLDEEFIHAIGHVFKDIRAEERVGSWLCPSRVSCSKWGMTQKRQCHARESGHPDLAARAGALDFRFRGNDNDEDLILNDAHD